MNSKNEAPLSDSVVDAEPKRGLSRRQVALGAAWSVPVIALAVASPAQAASVTLPTAAVGGSIGVVQGATVRTATYSGGYMNYNAAGTTTTSGNLTLTFAWRTTGSWTMSPPDTAGFTAQGWIQSSSSAGTLVFTHAPIADGTTVTIPTVKWTGTNKPQISVSLESDNDNVSGTSVATN
ncbi:MULTISPECIES: hypothetical protein [Subtercola]|uniref:Uncharacterized protein n=1 Tax=Subtercola vilae TaxID=2056433 RepID=A0A4T2C0U8_9MICO|nr:MULTISPECIES: hypothetical protein [Subtercola]MEA9986511.1 hypothetical protein [Subtercola sp. RTI3]TIH35598.1 hypothetical protein D4765_11080 [Subtercola vilae]